MSELVVDLQTFVPSPMTALALHRVMGNEVLLNTLLWGNVDGIDTWPDHRFHCVSVDGQVREWLGPGTCSALSCRLRFSGVFVRDTNKARAGVTAIFNSFVRKYNKKP